MLSRSAQVALRGARFINFKIFHKEGMTCTWNRQLQQLEEIKPCVAFDVPKRTKYMQHKGVKGIRNKKSFYDAERKAAIAGEDHDEKNNGEEEKDMLNLDDRAYDEVASNAMQVSRGAGKVHNVFIIQPYVKWSVKRTLELEPDDQLQEAKALIRSLPKWQVCEAIKVPLESLERKTLFGTGKMLELKTKLEHLRSLHPAPSCVFVSKGVLSFAQKRSLEMEFQLPIMDRYSVVIQILRLHATSAEAKVQVAMAELPYIWAQVKDANPSQTRKQGYWLTDAQREILKTRERKLRNELERIRAHRKLLRHKRKQKNYPVVAVVGYTNAGKTSLIKSLTQEQSIQPRDQLFATLDVTAHAGVLPCNLEVLYVDTVGFMSDLPTGLMECFIATLEDAMLADVIVHVHDLSHKCAEAQKAHVESTLQSLAAKFIATDCTKQQLPPVINVGNKQDLLPQIKQQENVFFVSAKEQTGLQSLLEELERQILLTTDRRKMTMRIRNGGAELAWLYKNAAVVNTRADEQSAEQLLITVVISELTLQQFRRQFCQ